MANLAAVLYGKEDLRLEDRPIREPGPGDVAVSVLYCGICGSDTYSYSYGTHGGFHSSEPLVMGHEASARVTHVGSDVKTIQVGDRVAFEPRNTCMTCKRCRQGRTHLCLVTKPWAAGIDGLLTRRKVLAANMCHRLPASIDDDIGALMEPLAVAVHACRRAKVQPGKSVLVLAAGTVGQLCMVTAKSMGVSNICITDIIQERLNISKKLGAPKTYLSQSRDIGAVSAELHQLMGEEPDITIECSGNAWCQTLAIQTTAAGGTVMLVGFGKDESQLPIATAVAKEIDLRTSVAYDRESFPIAIDMAASGDIDLSPLISHHYPLEGTLEALQQVCARTPGVMKVLINCQE